MMVEREDALSHFSDEELETLAGVEHADSETSASTEPDPVPDEDLQAP